MLYKTYSAKIDDVSRRWFAIDASGHILGRLATKVAKILMGKNKPIYTPHVDTGDHVVIFNASKIRLTSNKMKDKLYHRHSGYPGGLKTINFEDMHAKHPTRALMFAIKGMLPKGPLGRKMFLKLKIYAETNNIHQAQNLTYID